MFNYGINLQEKDQEKPILAVYSFMKERQTRQQHM